MDGELRLHVAAEDGEAMRRLELDITKSTLSEHLGAVQRELFDQLF